MSSEDLDLLTRGIVRTPAPQLATPPAEDSFDWVVHPDPNAVQTNVYVDGSRLDGEHDLYDLCSRQGWAFAASDADHRLVAAAHGRTPAWAEGIHAAELWGLLMAVHSTDPAAFLNVDCAAVQLGSQRGVAWASAPDRALASLWGPVAAGLEGGTDRGPVDAGP